MSSMVANMSIEVEPSAAGVSVACAEAGFAPHKAAATRKTRALNLVLVNAMLDKPASIGLSAPHLTGGD